MASDSPPALERFRQERGLSYERLGGMIGVSGVTARRLALGIRPADAIIADRIIKVTEGVVSVADLHASRLAFLQSQHEGAPQ